MTDLTRSLTDDITTAWNGHRWTQANGGDRCECGYFGWGELHQASIAASGVSARAEALAARWDDKSKDSEPTDRWERGYAIALRAAARHLRSVFTNPKEAGNG